MDVPLFYIVKRGLSAEQFEAVQAALSLTPCQAVFISNLNDHDLAWKFADQVIHADSEATAILLARTWQERTERPMLVVGEAELLDGVFADGHKEAITVYVPS